MECWGRSSPPATAKDPLGHVTGNAVSLGGSRCRTRAAVTPQGTAPCRTASPAQLCSLGTHCLQRIAPQLSSLPVCSGLFSESSGDHGAFSTTTFTLLRDSRCGARSCQAWTQLQPNAWLARRAAGQLQSHKQGHWATPSSPVPTALVDGMDLEESPRCRVLGWQGLWAQADLAH